MTETYAFIEANGDIDTIGDSPGMVRDRVLREYMGWKYDYPDLYPHDEAWSKLLEYGGRVAPVTITEIEPCTKN